MKNRTILKFSIAVCVLALFAGCASTNVTSDSQYMGFLPKPAQVMVYNFAVSPDEVVLESGISADIQDLINKNQTSRTDQERAIGRQVADALANHLVTEIQALGLPASRVSDAPAAANTLAVKGQFISINEGDQAERVVIGLGLGRTDVRTMTQVYDNRSGTNMLVTQFGINAESGAKPGAAETMGVGAVTGHLLVSAVVSSGVAVGSEAFSANVDADAARTAKKIAAQLKDFFLTQGWIQP